MKKVLILCTLFTLIKSNVISQNIEPTYTLKINFDSGEIIEKSEFFYNYGALTHKKTGKEIDFKNFKNLTFYRTDSDSIELEKIEIENFKNPKKHQFGIGYKLYKDDAFSLYKAYFGYFGDTLSERLFKAETLEFLKKYSNRNEVFIKRNNEKLSYTVGFVDGYGWERINQRLINFFSDCPNLKKALRKGKAYKKDIFSVLKFYNENCKQ